MHSLASSGFLFQTWTVRVERRTAVLRGFLLWPIMSGTFAGQRIVFRRGGPLGRDFVLTSGGARAVAIRTALLFRRYRLEAEGRTFRLSRTGWFRRELRLHDETNRELAWVTTSRRHEGGGGYISRQVPVLAGILTMLVFHQVWREPESEDWGSF